MEAMERKSEWSDDEMCLFTRSIARRVRRRYAPHMDLEDLMSLGMSGLLEAKGSFNPLHGSTFRQFTYLRTFGAMVDGARKWSGKSHASTLMKRDERKGSGGRKRPVSGTFRVQSLSEKPKEDRGEDRVPFPLQDPGLEARIEQRDLLRRIGKLSTHLPLEERVVLELYYGGSMDMASIGSLLERSKSWVSRKHNHAISSLRTAFETSEEGGELSGC